MTLDGPCGRWFTFTATTAIRIECLDKLRGSFLDVCREGVDDRRIPLGPGQVLELEAAPGRVTLWLGPATRAVIEEEGNSHG